MSLDEAIFARLHRWWTRRLRKTDATGVSVRFDDHRARLGHLACLLFGASARLAPAADAGGARGTEIRLPEAIGLFGDEEADLACYRLRLARLHAALAIGALGDGGTDALRALAAVAEQLPALDVALAGVGAGARELDRSLRRRFALRTGVLRSTCGPIGALVTCMLEDVPDPQQLRQSCAAALDARADRRAIALVRDALILFGTLPAAARAEPTDRAVEDPIVPDALPTGTEREARSARGVETIELDEKDDGANPLAHVFEKVRTAEEHTGGRRSIDGSDELAEHVEALDELDLRRVVRSRMSAASVFRADLDIESAPIDLAGDEQSASTAITYDEWDERDRRYLVDWCRVYVGRVAEPATRVDGVLDSIRRRHRREIAAVQAEFARIDRARRLRRRQTTGNDIDLDAMVARRGAVVAAYRGLGSLREERVYLQRRADRHDVASLILIDTSLSSDSWVAGRRVLDVARESVVVLGEAIAGVRLSVAIAAFDSHTRRDCRFGLVKDFDDDWRSGERRLFGLRPQGYTRIGPALRHATHLLERTGARRKLLILLSDCKPTDYDHYEGRRGIGDVRQAVREARVRQVTTLALTIGARAHPHLPRMFGGSGFRVLRGPSALPLALADLHERLIR